MKFLVFLATLWVTAASAQIGGAPIGPGPGGGGSGGGGTVTSITPGCGSSTSPNPLTTTGVIATTLPKDLETGSNFPIPNSDCGVLINLSNASAQTPTIAQAGTGGNFASGWYAPICNIGAGTQTLTPTTSTINGAASYPFYPGQCGTVQSDGTNYNIISSFIGPLPALSSPTAAVLQFGAADVAAPVAQTIQAQSVVAGTTNTAGANLTIIASKGSGNQLGGDILFQSTATGSSGTAQGTPFNMLTIEPVGAAAAAGAIMILPNNTNSDVQFGASGGPSFGPGATGSTNLALSPDSSQNVMAISKLSGLYAVIVNANAVAGWSATTAVTTNPDTGISRDSAAVFDFGNGTLSDKSGTIQAAHATLGSLANTATTSAVCYDTATGVLTYDGTIGTCNTSDERLKNVDGPITDALSKVLQIHGIYFHYKDPTQGEGRKIGLIAQNVETVFPELVATDVNGVKSLDYQKMVAPIIEAMREQQEDIALLKAQVSRLSH